MRCHIAPKNVLLPQALNYLSDPIALFAPEKSGPTDSPQGISLTRLSHGGDVLVERYSKTAQRRNTRPGNLACLGRGSSTIADENQRSCVMACAGRFGREARTKHAAMFQTAHKNKSIHTHAFD